MCGRYTIYSVDELAERFDTAPVKERLPASYNAAPGQFLPVVTENETGRQLEVMKWGLVPAWAKDENIGYKMINARAESLFAKPAWRAAVKRRRCLIPANGFYEWKKLSESGKIRKQPYYIHPRQTDTFAFAGIWDSWKDIDDNELHTYSIITTEPNEEMTAIHNRMPVILHPEDEPVWLTSDNDGQQDVLEALLHPYQDNGLDMFPVSTEVNITANNDAKLIYPMNSQ